MNWRQLYIPELEPTPKEIVTSIDIEVDKINSEINELSFSLRALSMNRIKAVNRLIIEGCDERD